MGEEESDDMTPNYWAGEAVEADVQAIDVVLKHRRKEDNVKQHPDKDDFEFFIKWQGKAHYHSTWESYSTLTSFKGLKRLENYFRKIVGEELFILSDPEVALEEKEQWNLNRERDSDALLDYMQVERVIDQRDGEEDTEYFVKWKGLGYDSCTWEDATLISELAQNEIDRYLDRISKSPTSNKTESNPHSRSPYVAFKTQPPYIKNGQLREFQVKGLNFLAHNWCKDQNVILADEMGLGKTVQTISFMSWLRHDRGQQGPFIVVVPLSTMPAWAETFNVWAPDTNYVVYNGNEAARSIIRENELFVDSSNPRGKVKFNVLLTTYEYILHDAAFLSQLKWQFMAVDEAHRLKNKDSQLYARLMEFGAPSRLLITGTPVQNNLTELAALMNFLNPGKIQVDENIDLQSEAASQKLAELTDNISPYMIRRTKQKVENDLPPKTEKIIRVELSDIQLEYYKNILTRNYTALNQGSKGHKQSLLNIMMELKKASNHPFMFPNAEERILAGSTNRDDVMKGLITSSGKMMLLDQLLIKMKKDGHRVLIFSQMVKMLDLLADYLKARGHQFQRLDGTIASGPRRMAIDHFNAPNSQDFCFLLSTRAGGLGINLMTADTVILFDSDWNPQADLQAMARAHRIGQKNPVTIYRFVSKDTIEEEILERARNKLMLEFITIQRGVTDKEAKDLNNRMQKAGAVVGEPASSDDINKILKRRGQKMFEQTGNQKKLEELDIDAVLENAEEHKTEQPEGIAADGGEEFLKSFEYTDVKIDLEWDDIIPKDQLVKIKAEETKKREEAELARIVEQNAPRKRKVVTDERGQRAAKRAKEEHDAGELEDDSADMDSDPKRPLQENEIRRLIRAYERYGSLDERTDDVLLGAKLLGRDIDVVKGTLREILDICQRLCKEERDRLVALEVSGKVVTKKDKKMVQFDFRGVRKVNAATLLDRPGDMRMLKGVLASAGDWKSFRIPEASKGATYTSEWGSKEDGMLCVGMDRHGYGAWVAIRDDPDLGLGDKFYLEEHQVAKKEERNKTEEKNIRSPGAVHLVRRANYLLSVLKDKTSNGMNIAAKKALENHHRNTKKSVNALRRVEKSARVSPSPAPGGIRKPVRDGDRARQRVREASERVRGVDRQGSERPGTPNRNNLERHGSSTGVNGTSRHRRRGSNEKEPLKNIKTKGSKSSSDRHQAASSKAPLAKRDLIEEFFGPVYADLTRHRDAQKKATKEKDDDLKLKSMKSLIKIATPLITEAGKKKGEDFERRCWYVVSHLSNSQRTNVLSRNHFTDHYWPKKDTSADKIKEIAMRILSKDALAAAAPKAKTEPSSAAKATTTPTPKSKGESAAITKSSSDKTSKSKSELPATAKPAVSATSKPKVEASSASRPVPMSTPSHEPRKAAV